MRKEGSHGSGFSLKLESAAATLSSSTLERNGSSKENTISILPFSETPSTHNMSSSFRCEKHGNVHFNDLHSREIEIRH
jgi:hypothetical protein